MNKLSTRELYEKAYRLWREYYSYCHLIEPQLHSVQSRAASHAADYVHDQVLALWLNADEQEKQVLREAKNTYYRYRDWRDNYALSSGWELSLNQRIEARCPNEYRRLQLSSQYRKLVLG